MWSSGKHLYINGVRFLGPWPGFLAVGPRSSKQAFGVLHFPPCRSTQQPRGPLAFYTWPQLLFEQLPSLLVSGSLKEVLALRLRFVWGSKLDLNTGAQTPLHGGTSAFLIQFAPVYCSRIVSAFHQGSQVGSSTPEVCNMVFVKAVALRW